MTLRTALPGLAAGSLGLVAGFFGLVLQAPVLAAVAGLLALAAGLACVLLARRLDDQIALHGIIEQELRTERARAGDGPLYASRQRGGADSGRSPLASANPSAPAAPAGPLFADPAPTPTSGPTSAATSAPASGPAAADAARTQEPVAGTGTPGARSEDGAGPPTRSPDGPSLDVDGPRLDVTGPNAPAGPITPPLSEGEPLDDSALVDRATGLFSETFFRVALEARIAAARRHLRPIAVVLIEVVEGLPASEPVPVEAELISATVKATLREADTSCRLRNGYFALLLEDTPENGAIWTVERIRRGLADSRDGLTVWAGVACYPAHAFTPDEILGAAEKALFAAREWRQDRIEVAVAAD